MTFEQFKEEFDSIFDQLSPQELVADFEQMGYRFIPIKETATPILGEGENKKIFSTTKRAKIKILSKSYHKSFYGDFGDNSLLLAA